MIKIIEKIFGVDITSSERPFFIIKCLKIIGVIVIILFFKAVVENAQLLEKIPLPSIYISFIIMASLLVSIVALFYLIFSSSSKVPAEKIDVDDISKQKDSKMEDAHNHFEDERYKEAGDLYRQVTKEQPKNPEGWEGLGNCFEKLAIDKKALKFFLIAEQCVHKLAKTSDANPSNSEGYMKLVSTNERLRQKIKELREVKNKGKT